MLRSLVGSEMCIRDRSTGCSCVCMSSLLVLCCLFAGVLGSDVLPATADNFESLVKQHPHVLAQFSAPWCGHCKNLAPEFESAATTLKTADPPVALIQIDATVDKALAEKYDVKGFPTLRWIHSGEAAEFTGGRDAASIVAWCKKKSGAPSTELVDPKAVDEFASQATAVLLGLMDPDAPEWGEFIKVASTLDEIPVGHTSHEAVVKQHAPAKVVMLQKFDDGLQKYSGAMTAPEMKRWARANALPLVTEFTRETQPRIFADSAPSKHLLALHPAKYGEKDGMVAVLREVAANHKGEVLAITVEENSDNSGVFNFFGVKADDVKASPRVVGIDQIGTAMKKYFFTGTVAEPALSQWVEDWLSGKVSPTLKSATPPIESENQEPVRIVVGSTFKREVIQSAKDLSLIHI
eukprot:TRINITY_DN2176_c0_g3_i1.p1 TRINITY_DN2176_c0_g3~~TRINITY_DN2176_c0_g3_i1.p1  ORF type:complete len:408 (-),score=134.22 TRINITY_DN2176_c0_g3_i1:154-1377(-)